MVLLFVEKNVKDVVIACNTTSAVAYEELKRDFEGKLNIFPLIQSVAKYAIKNLKDNDTIAILATLATINSKKYDSIILNYANPDMVGHTGNLEAAVKALEVIDECVQRVVETVEKNNGILLITADHGNSEQMIDYTTGEPHTAHTTNIVPLVVVGKDVKLKEGRLADLIPTMLDIMGIEKPQEMTGDSLLEK